MASGVTKWNGQGVTADVRREIGRRMEAAARQVESKAIQLISKDQPIRRSKSGRMVGLSPAAPGQPPKVLHGRLRQSVTNEVEIGRRNVIGRVGTNLVYGRVHELGTHPWLRPALLKTRSAIKQIFGVGTR